MLYGNWSNLIRKLDQFQSELDDLIKQALIQSGEYVESTAVKHLKNQDLPWQPLTPRYLARKLRYKAKGSRTLSEKILIATGTYFQSITTYIEGLIAFVGVKRGVAREEDGTDVVNIAIVHELGAPNANIPARPLWKPTLEECKNEIIERFKKALIRLLR